MGKKTLNPSENLKPLTMDDYHKLQEKFKELENKVTAYQAKEELFNRIQTLLQFGTFEWDIETNILNWSTDIDSGNTGDLTKVLKELVHPEDYHKVVDQIHELLKTSKSSPSELRIINSANQTRYIRFESEIILDDNQKPVKVYGVHYDITESIQARQEKVETEEQFKLFMNHFPGAAFIKDKNNMLVYCNNYFASFINKTPEELIGHDISQLIPDENESQFLIENREVIEQRRVMEMEHTYPGPDGPTFWMTFKFPIIKTDQSVMVGSISFDMTTSKNAQIKLAESESRLQSIFRVSPVGIGLVSNRILLQVNNRVCEMTGYSQNELIGKNSRIFYANQEDFDWVCKVNLEQTLEKGTGMVETVWQRKDGTLIDVLLSTTPLNFEDYTTGVTFTALDITERKKAERELSDSQRQLFTLFNNLPGLAYRCKNDEFWTMEFISSGCEKLTGYMPQDFINNAKLSYADIIHPDDQENVDKTVQEAVKRNDHFELEYRIITADNQIKNVLERGIGIFSKEGHLLHLEGFISDITARKQAQLQLQNELMEKEVLLKEVHHRVKNNLQIIISLLNMQSNQNEDPYIKDAFSECISRIHSMSLVHEKMYRSTSFAKIDFKEYISSISKQIFNSNKVSSKIKYQLQLEDIYLELNKAIPCGLVLNELITNAFKHAFPGEKEGKLLIKINQDKEKNCIITIKDNGIGIPPAIDYQSSESMGFILIRVLTKQLDGHLQLKSSKKGTEFKITFPL